MLVDGMKIMFRALGGEATETAKIDPSNSFER